MDAYEEYGLKNFSLHYPYEYKKMAEAQYIGDDEFVIYLNNGDRLIYDAIDNRIIRNIGYLDGRSFVTEEEWVIEFSRKLRKKLNRRNFSQDDFAELMGVSPFTISNYVRGKRIPTSYIMSLMATALHCSCDELTDFNYLIEEI